MSRHESLLDVLYRYEKSQKMFTIETKTYYTPFCCDGFTILLPIEEENKVRFKVLDYNNIESDGQYEKDMIQAYNRHIINM